MTYQELKRRKKIRPLSALPFWTKWAEIRPQICPATLLIIWPSFELCGRKISQLATLTIISRLSVYSCWSREWMWGRCRGSGPTSPWARRQWPRSTSSSPSLVCKGFLLFHGPPDLFLYVIYSNLLLLLSVCCFISGIINLSKRTRSRVRI